MRGKLQVFDRLPLARRITPAHAGKTDDGQRIITDTADHPRACGENKSSHSAYGKVHGSPPRMRGKPCKLSLTVKNVRITPAHAGKTRIFVSIDFVTTDHPRACGENREEGYYAWQNGGSPPRMRGKLS